MAVSHDMKAKGSERKKEGRECSSVHVLTDMECNFFYQYCPLGLDFLLWIFLPGVCLCYTVLEYFSLPLWEILVPGLSA